MVDHNLRKHVQARLSSFPLLGVGSGSFGKVYEASGPQSEKYALKISSLSDASDKEEGYLLSELSTLARFNHPHIVKYVSGWEERDRRGELHIYLLMEYCEGRDLKTYLNNEGRPKGDKLFGTWLTHIASGLHHVHSYNVLHRNLKTSNILVHKQGKHVVLKIGDFGMSKILDHPGAMTGTRGVGTPYFMSPEALRGDRYNYKTDIWSFGCTAFEMAALKTIFQAQTIRTLMSGVKKGLENVLQDNVKYSRFFKTLIGKMLNTKAEHRPDAASILQDLAAEGYTSMHLADLQSSASSSQRSRSDYSSTNTLTPVPELDELDPRTHKQESHPKPPKAGKPIRERSQSESDIVYKGSDLELGLAAFSRDRRNAKGLKPLATIDSSVEDTPRTHASRSSGSGYETDISCSGASSVYFTSTPRTNTSTASDYGTDEEIYNDGEEDDAAATKRMKIVGSITKFQTKITETVGKDKFVAACETVCMVDDSEMISVLKDILAGDYEEVGPHLIYLRLLETKLEALDEKNTLPGGPLMRTT